MAIIKRTSQAVVKAPVNQRSQYVGFRPARQEHHSCNLEVSLFDLTRHARLPLCAGETCAGRVK